MRPPETPSPWQRAERFRTRWPWLIGVLVMCFPVHAALHCPPLVEKPPAADPVSYADSLLWEVRVPHRPASYLFGTIHLSADRVGQPSPGVVRALEASRHFGMEVVLDIDALREVAQGMRFADDRRLSGALDAALFARTVELLAQYGVTREDAEQLKPWAAYTTLSLPPDMAVRPLDLVLLEAAREAHKTVFGLETLAEQMAVFEGLSDTDQGGLLRESVCHHERLQEDTAALITHYAAGDLLSVYRVSQRYESALQDRLMQKLLYARNQRMLVRLAAPLAQGNAFIAIGALHLPGRQGVLAGLVAAGYRVLPRQIR